MHLQPMQMMILALTLIIAVGNQSRVDAGDCPIGNQFDQLMITCYSASNRYNCMTKGGYCGTSATDPLVLYQNCTESLSKVMLDAKGSDCVSIFTTSDKSGLSPAAKENKAKEYCDMAYPSFISRLCDPIGECPDDDEDLLVLVALANCLLPTGKTEEELETYNPYECLQKEEETVDVPKVCEEKSELSAFRSCSKNTFEVINDILKSNSTDAESCNSLLVGPVLNPYCSQKFGESLKDFCTPPLCNQAVLGIPMCALIGGASAIGGLAIFAVACCCIVRRNRGAKSKDYLNVPEGRNGSNLNVDSRGSFGHITISPQQQNGYSPTGMIAQQQNIGFVGMIPSGVPQGSFGQIPVQQVQISMPPVSPAAEDTDSRHRRELVEFYQFHDPDRSDIEAHVEKLMSKYDFKSIAKALKSKYGLLPPGWDEELAKPSKRKQNTATVANDSSTPGNSEEQKQPNSAPKFLKYNQMAKLGLPETAIVQAMERDGVDPAGWVYAP